MSFFQKLFSFKHTPNHSTAVSWNDGILRGIKVARDPEKTWIDSYSEHILPPDTILDGRVRDKSYLLEALRGMQKKFNTKEVSVLLPEEEAFVFHTSVDRIPGIGFDIEKGVIEDHLKSYIVTHDVLSGAVCSCEYDVVHRTPDSMNLHVAVIADRIIEEYSNIIRSSGMVPASLEVSAHHVSRHCNDYYSEGMVLVDFGRLRTVVALSHKGKILARKIVPVGYENFSRVIQKFLGVDREEAEYIVNHYGLLGTHPEKGLLSELTMSLGPITNTIDQIIVENLSGPYRPAHFRFGADGIVLYGNGSWVKGLQLFLQTKTQLPVTTFSPIGQRIHAEHCLSLSADKALLFGPILSLAIEHLRD